MCRNKAKMKERKKTTLHLHAVYFYKCRVAFLHSFISALFWTFFSPILNWMKFYSDLFLSCCIYTCSKIDASSLFYSYYTNDQEHFSYSGCWFCSHHLVWTKIPSFFIPSENYVLADAYWNWICLGEVGSKSICHNVNCLHALPRKSLCVHSSCHL